MLMSDYVVGTMTRLSTAVSFDFQWPLVRAASTRITKVARVAPWSLRMGPRVVLLLPLRQCVRYSEAFAALFL